MTRRPRPSGKLNALGIKHSLAYQIDPMRGSLRLTRPVSMCPAN
jgi:hypothetical protein